MSSLLPSSSPSSPISSESGEIPYIHAFLKVSYKRAGNENLGFRPSNLKVDVDSGFPREIEKHSKRAFKVPLPRAFKKLLNFSCFETFVRTTVSGPDSYENKVLLSAPCPKYPSVHNHKEEMMQRMFERLSEFISVPFKPFPQVQSNHISGDWENRNWWYSGNNCMVARIEKLSSESTFISVVFHDGNHFDAVAKKVEGYLESKLSLEKEDDIQIADERPTRNPRKRSANKLFDEFIDLESSGKEEIVGSDEVPLQSNKRQRGKKVKRSNNFIYLIIITDHECSDNGSLGIPR
jgi:hypothetical protein